MGMVPTLVQGCELPTNIMGGPFGMHHGYGTDPFALVILNIALSVVPFFPPDDAIYLSEILPGPIKYNPRRGHEKCPSR